MGTERLLALPPDTLTLSTEEEAEEEVEEEENGWVKDYPKERHTEGL